jgi:cation transport regulator ChaC
MIGILAYGSLIANPGDEIQHSTERVVDDVLTPFEVEYARKSKGRGYAPTLIPVGLWQGGRVKARIFVLKPDVSERQAVDVLYRRERDKVGQMRTTYPLPTQVTLDAVQVERLFDFAGIERVLYTRIGVNLPEILDPNVPLEKKARLLAYLAIESIEEETFERQRDGIQYLLDNLAVGVETPLSRPYEAAILEIAGNSPNLSEARLYIAREKGIIP